MSLGNAAEISVGGMIFKGVDPARRASETAYLALVAGSSIDEADPLALECSYGGYARVPITKATARPRNGNQWGNAALVQWAKRTDEGAAQTAKYAVLCDTASGATTMAVIGEFTDTLQITKGIQPQAEPGLPLPYGPASSQ